MRMPGQTWPGLAAAFLGMWVVMMVAMMLPSLVPMLGRYRQAVVTTSKAHLGWLTALVGLGYFFVWTVVGVAVFPLGVALAAIETQLPELARAVPIAIGVVVVIAGALQFTAWKARQLACCREAPGCDRTLPADARTAWRHGLRLGLHCGACCANLMAILLVVGVMDRWAMAVVTAAITAERLAPAGERVARAVGVIVVGAGLFLLLPESGEPGRHQLVVPHPAVQGADLAGEAADVGHHLLGNGRVVEGSVARHLVRDEACLFGRK
jgi:predicted metal-binding membrane protein